MDKLNEIIYNKAPSKSKVYRWYCEFISDQSSMHDEFREDRPKSEISKTIYNVCELILQDCYVIYEETEIT